MGLFDPVAVALPTEAQQQLTAKLIGTNLASTLTNITQAFQRIFNYVWGNQYGLTPQQVCDALGTNAGTLFTLAQSLKTLINAAKPGAITATEPNAYTINQDGTVTIGDPISNS